jgi:large repetitive protein
MDPDEEVVSGGGGPGKEFAKLSKHVLPLALFLVILTIALLGLLIFQWPSCEINGCKATSKAGPPLAPGSGVSSPLEVSALEPVSGTICGGTAVRITGSGFSQGMPTVSFGGLPAHPTMRDGTSLVVTTPAHWEAAVDVIVKIKDTDKAVTLTKGFSYVCPERTQGRLLLLVVLAGMLGGVLHSLRSLFWFSGNRNLRVSWLWMYYLLPLSGAVIATIFFLVFVAGLFSPEGTTSKSFFLMVGVAALVGMFSPQAVEKLKKISEAILTTVPPSADRTPKPLTLTEVKPLTGPTTGGTSVTLTGTGFAPGATVTFGGAPATGMKVTSTQIDAVTPPHVAGKVDVEVCNPDSGMAKKAAGFEYVESQTTVIPPTPLLLATVNPSTGPISGGTTVVLTGTGFAAGATVTFGGAPATGVKVTSMQIEAVTPPHEAGKVDVEVRNSESSTVKMAEGFEYAG